MQIEFAESEINFTREKEFNINYKGIILPHKFYADFGVMGDVIVEVKATKEGILYEFIAQALNYLKVSGCSLGLIIHFGKSSLKYKRLVLQAIFYPCNLCGPWQKNLSRRLNFYFKIIKTMLWLL